MRLFSLWGLILLLCSCGQSATRTGESQVIDKPKEKPTPYPSKEVFTAMANHYGKADVASGLLAARWQTISKTPKLKSDSFMFHVEFWIERDGSMRLKFLQTLGQFLDVSMRPGGEITLYAPTEGIYVKSTTKELFGHENACPELICLEALLGPFPVMDTSKPVKLLEEQEKLIIEYHDSVVGLPAKCTLRRDAPIVLSKEWKKDGVIFAEVTYEGEKSFDGGIRRPYKVVWQVPDSEYDQIYTVSPRIFDKPKDIIPDIFNIKIPESARQVSEKELNQIIRQRIRYDE